MATEKISKEEFIRAAIRDMRDRRPDSYGLPHRRLSYTYQQYYGEELVPELERLERSGSLILKRDVWGGIMIYDPADLPPSWPKNQSLAIKEAMRRMKMAMAKTGSN
jgi:hypothetical protein